MKRIYSLLVEYDEPDVCLKFGGEILFKTEENCEAELRVSKKLVEELVITSTALVENIFFVVGLGNAELNVSKGLKVSSAHVTVSFQGISLHKGRLLSYSLGSRIVIMLLLP